MIKTAKDKKITKIVNILQKSGGYQPSRLDCFGFFSLFDMHIQDQNTDKIKRELGKIASKIVKVL